MNMTKNIKSIFSSELARGGSFLIVGTLIYNLLNYFFHFSMARMLGPADYGVLASLMAIVYLFSIPSETIQMTIAKYTAVFRAKKETGKLKSLVRRSISRGWKMGIVFLFIFIAVSPFIKSFLKLDSIIPLIILSLFIFPTLLLPIMRGVLQGSKRFKALGLSFTLEGLIKLILAVSLVFIGYKVNGAIGAVLVSSFLVFILLYLFLRDTNKKKEKYFQSKELYLYSLPVLVAIICITVAYSIDTILAKHFFSETNAGLYAVASLLGKMIFFALSPIAKVMFPIVVEKKESKKDYEGIIKKVLMITAGIAAVVIAIYFFFSKLIVSILFGNQYLEIAGIIGYLSIAFTLLTLSYILIFYKLSLGKKKFVLALPFFAILEIVALSVFNSSLLQFSIALLAVNLAMCLFLALIKK